MCCAVGRNPFPEGLRLLILLFTVSGAVAVHAASLALAGITEGSQIILPASISSTELSISATVSGIGGSPRVEFALEWSGTVIGRATSGPPYAITFNDLFAGKYFLSARVANSPEVAADVSFDILPASLRPANDHWNQAHVITMAGTAVLGTNVYATWETGEPSPLPNAAGRSIWWSWQANTNGAITATTAGSSFDTTLAVYQGSSLAGLTLVGTNDDAGPGSNTFSQVSFNAVAGTNYYFAVDGVITPEATPVSGNVQLQIHAATPVAVTITLPLDGAGLLVASPSTTTNVSATALVSAPSEVERLEYSLDGNLPTPLSGTIRPPYQWNLAHLLPGDYWLSVTTTSTNGLLATAHTGFSVISLAPNVELVDSPGISPTGLPIAITGLKGTSYTLQSSSNLIAWSELKRWTNFPGAERVNATNDPPASAGFYRAAFP